MRVHAIEVIPGKVGTNEVQVDLPLVDGCLESGLGQDTLKTLVFERHHEMGTNGCGFTKGFGIKRGAMASSVAYGAHNLLVAGMNDEDMALAANTLIARDGGMAVVADSEGLGLVELPIAGLMDARRGNEREGAFPGGCLGRDRLHHAIPVHDDGPDPSGLPARAAPDEPRFGGLHDVRFHGSGGAKAERSKPRVLFGPFLSFEEGSPSNFNLHSPHGE